MSDHRAEREWQPYDACPCGEYICIEHVQSAKLTKFGHVVGCRCRPCIGRRNKRKGHRAQAKMHRALGGTGFTPHDEESARPYTIEVTVMPESKTGDQIPASFDRFIGTEWFRRALEQSSRATPVGSGVLPAVVVRGEYAIVDIRPKLHGPYPEGQTHA